MAMVLFEEPQCERRGPPWQGPVVKERRRSRPPAKSAPGPVPERAPAGIPGRGHPAAVARPPPRVANSKPRTRYIRYYPWQTPRQIDTSADRHTKDTLHTLYPWQGG